MVKNTLDITYLFTQHEIEILEKVLMLLRQEQMWIKGELPIGVMAKNLAIKLEKIEGKPYWRSLMIEPDEKSVKAKGIIEALAGIVAEEKGMLPGPLRRDPTKAAEFIDVLGRPWDVKTPPSFAYNGKRVFNVEKVITGIENNLRDGENVILSLIRSDQNDALNLLKKIDTVFPQKDKDRIITVFRNDLF